MRPTNGHAADQAHLAERYRTTRRGVVERLADPYLTEHDRWVLHQFARFLGGQTPEPDPRVKPAPPPPSLYARVRRSTL